MHFPYTHKQITGDHYHMLKEKIRTGDVILTKTNGELSNIINPNKIKHGAIFVGDIYSNGILYVLEAVGRGVVLTDLVTFLTTKDLLIVSRPKTDIQKDLFSQALKGIALKVLNTPYDFIFNIGKEAFYCFELVAFCLNTTDTSLKIKPDEIAPEKWIYNYDAFLNSKFFAVIYNSTGQGK